MGRPLKFKTPEEMQKAIDAYFADCEAKNYTDVKTGKTVEYPLTITGLGLAIGLSRQSILNYEIKEEFLDTVKEAKARVENFAERRLFGDANSGGAIFALKNHGWSDKSESDVNMSGDSNNPFTINLQYIKHDPQD